MQTKFPKLKPSPVVRILEAAVAVRGRLRPVISEELTRRPLKYPVTLLPLKSYRATPLARQRNQDHARAVGNDIDRVANRFGVGFSAKIRCRADL